MAMKKRVESVLKQKGLNSSEYLDALIKDVTDLVELESMPIEEVLTEAKVSNDIYSASYDNHVGEESHIDRAFVKNFMEIMYFHPIKNS